MPRSFNSTITWIAIGAAAVGVVVLGTLIAIASGLHVVTRDISTAVESVRVADEIELQLLVTHAATSPVVRGASTAALKRAVEESAGFVQSAGERQRQAEVAQAVDAYLRSGNGDAEVGAALSAAVQLSLLNLRQAREAERRAQLWDRLSEVGGPAAVILLLAGVTMFLVWLHRGPFRRVAAVSRAMERFSAGDLDARAPEEGAREVVVMSRSFNAAAGALVRARQRQTEYVATAIHDLRVPLSAIQLAVGYISPTRPLPPEPRIRQLMELINRQLKRLHGLVGDVLNATWIEAGVLELHRESFDLRTIAATSVQTFRELAPEHVIELDIPEEPVVIDGDRARLAQVVNNLLSNAIKYSPRGSRVRVDVALAGGGAVLAVSDEGRGIAPEDRASIFDAFQRQSATHEEAPGTSLGLWVSRRVVEAHAGRMELESRVGEGSTFRVLLPLEATRTEHLPAEAPPPPGAA